MQQLCRMTPRVSPHFPWDRVDDYRVVADSRPSARASASMRSTRTPFRTSPASGTVIARGSLASTDATAREQAIAHNIECIEIGEQLGSKAITVWIGDGSNFPGQQDLTRAFDRYLESSARIYAALPDDWRMLLEHKLYEPAFYRPCFRTGGPRILAAQSSAQGAVPRRSGPPCAKREHRADRRPAATASESSAAFISTTASMATTISIPARSIRTSCFWSSTSW